MPRYTRGSDGLRHVDRRPDRAQRGTRSRQRAPAPALRPAGHPRRPAPAPALDPRPAARGHPALRRGAGGGRRIRGAPARPARFHRADACRHRPYRRRRPARGHRRGIADLHGAGGRPPAPERAHDPPAGAGGAGPGAGDPRTRGERGGARRGDAGGADRRVLARGAGRSRSALHPRLDGDRARRARHPGPARLRRGGAEPDGRPRPRRRTTLAFAPDGLHWTLCCPFPPGMGYLAGSD